MPHLNYILKKKIEEMSKLYFENVVEIGNLYLDYIIYEFENEPILFICKSENCNLYLCLCSEIRYEQKWIIVKCNPSILEKLAKKEIDIANAFLSSNDAIIIKMNLNGVEESSIVEMGNIDRLDLPEPGVFLRGDQTSLIDYIEKQSHIYKQPMYHYI